MTTDSKIFWTYKDIRAAGYELSGNKAISGENTLLPLIEAKMVHQFDHRHGGYPLGKTADTRSLPRPSEAEKVNPGWDPLPRYWVDSREVKSKLEGCEWDREWLLGWRDITNVTNERTLIASAMPVAGIAGLNLVFPRDVPPVLCAVLIANMNSLVVDFVARQKMGGTHLTAIVMKQLPILPPSAYSDAMISFILERIHFLSCVSYSLCPFALDMGFTDEAPFSYNEQKRAFAKSELDAFFAFHYGLTRDELIYILDPKEAMGQSYPSESFRVLQKNDIREHGDYRTKRLVLAAWDRLFGG
jgi:hypothetical protein